MRWLAAVLALCVSAVSSAQVVVGAVVPQTGLLADAASGYLRGLTLWAERVNAGGGLLGQAVALVVLDDGSETRRVAPLYEALIAEHRADALVGPFGSAATLVAAGVAERTRRVMLNAVGASPGIHRKGTRYVFQVNVPPVRYGRGVLEVAQREGIARLLVLARDDPAARAAAARLREDAVAAGLACGPVLVYKPGTDDFGAHIAQAKKDAIEGWIAFGLAADAAAMVKSLRKHGWAPALFVAQGAADPAFIRMVGQDAELAIGISAYEAHAPTEGNREFVQAYARRWGTPPDAYAAAAYSAGQLLEQAAARAGTLAPEALREALASGRYGTLLGDYRVDENGAQTATAALLLQIQRGRREIVWPEPLASARWRLPFPSWEGRRPIE
ncbi:MAG: ABC transporter substrate-binding protein [Burkholderiales bacterium]|nr:ABC transporter substrate-binding protein [Burkholderiales bacterium]